MTQIRSSLPGYGVRAYAAGAIRVQSGANLGDPIGGPGLCEPGDVYRLRAEARSRRLMLCEPRAQGCPQQIAQGSEVGQPGEAMHPTGLLTLLTPDGERLLIVTARHEPSGALYALPLSPMRARIDYTLVDVAADPAGIRLADVICVSFAAGTMITLPGGAQKAIEALRPGDVILTRDSGGQPARWIAKATLRAQGSFAPIVISSGTFGNIGDLVVSPHHRIFIYQRGSYRLGGVAEILVQAKHLVDDDRVWRREGGFVDYYSLIFDRHEIIYAEGIPTESLMVTDESFCLLPDDLAEEITARLPGLRHSPHFAPEPGRQAVSKAGPASLFHTGGR